MIHKKCNSCSLEKPLIEFFLDKRTNSPRGKCKVCYYKITSAYRIANRPKYRKYSQDFAKKNPLKVNLYKKNWRKANPEKVAEIKKRSYRRNSGRTYFYNTKNKYGVTEEMYTKMLQNQGGVCAICCKEDVKRRLNVDHCHQTGKVRGLLCNNCNRALGLLADQYEFLSRATLYLSK